MLTGFKTAPKFPHAKFIPQNLKNRGNCFAFRAVTRIICFFLKKKFKPVEHSGSCNSALEIYGYEI